MPKITICIPSYNNGTTIYDTLKSAREQEYPDKEVLVCDDASTDNTVAVATFFQGVRVIINSENIGIGQNLVKLMNEAKGKYVVYLCADDVFTHPKVVTDIVNQFDRGDPAIGVLGRYYYYFRDGYDGAIGTCRERNIIINSCCPSGMAFRRMDNLKATNKIFIEMPYIVKQYLSKWRWSMFEYDTVAARFKPGTNTGTKKEYYTESPLQNWIYLTGDKNFKDYQSFIMLKNRACNLLWREICLHVKMNKKVLLELKFWVYSLTALLIPSMLLRNFTKFYRHRIARLSAKIIERPS